MELFRDGINADRCARDYKRVVAEVSVKGGRALSDSDIIKDGLLHVHLAPGGGFVARIILD